MIEEQQIDYSKELARITVTTYAGGCIEIGGIPASPAQALDILGSALEAMAAKHAEIVYFMNKKRLGII